MAGKPSVIDDGLTGVRSKRSDVDQTGDLGIVAGFGDHGATVGDHLVGWHQHPVRIAFFMTASRVGSNELRDWGRSRAPRG
jgi:hypothetical protein